MTRHLVQGIAERALGYVLDAPPGEELVIEHASPEQLLEVFGASVGLELPDAAAAAAPNAVLDAVDLVLKHSMHTSHPRFVNQNFAGPDPVAVVGDFLGAALNTTGATFEVAPVFTLMESAVLHKLGRLAGYVPPAPAAGSVLEMVPPLPPGIFCAGGSMATLLALQLARHRVQPDMPRRGAGPERLVLFVSSSGHYAALKSAALLGLGMDAVVKVASDQDGAMRPAALDEAIAEARVKGDRPFAVIATAGTTVTSAFDDLHALADTCEREDLWLHVDGCYGGSALFSPAQAHRLDGVERSDSFVWNLHKMMGITQQCTALLVREPERLAACFATRADYLFQPDKLHGDYDTGDRTFQCARRIDVLKLWLTWQVRGDAGFVERIDHAVAMAAHARHRVGSSAGAFVPVVGGDFTNVVFAFVPEEERSAVLPATVGQMLVPASLEPERRERLHRLAPRVKARMQAEGSAMIGYQPVHGLNVFRLLFMNPKVTTADVDAMLALLERYGTEEWPATEG